MKLFLIGCEYSGTTTLAHAIKRMDQARQWIRSLPLSMTTSSCRDTNPHGPELTEEEVAQFAALSPRLTEVIQRHKPFTITHLLSLRREKTFSESVSISKTEYTDPYTTVTADRASWATGKR